MTSEGPDLFGDAGPPVPPPVRKAARPRTGVLPGVLPAVVDADTRRIADAVPRRIRLGTSSWSFPGWTGLVWGNACSDAALAKSGLGAYAQHPALRTVSLDRTFYRPLSASQYAAYAAQVPDDFRFVVKAPSLITDAVVRGEAGRGMQPNPAFLDPALAVSEFVQPALDGLGAHIGALVFQLSPLPAAWLQRLPELLERLAALLAALPPLKPVAPDGIVAVEVRNPELLTPAFAAVLRAAGATYCLGLHPRLPPVQDQLPVLRALWPGPLVCRWSLHGRHGAQGYEEAKGLYEPFDRLVDPDPATRGVLARVMAATAAAGHNVYVTVNNKAEGSAPLSVLALAQAVGGSAPGAAGPVGQLDGAS
ncbi:MAG: DUF72 domain-containing protein [Proteobacteria bacterium]|jgi:uncharacterized protein YecE (DUF72 family)|nr:DUF72 domain-containing protein [Ramlibacter sp.]MCA0213208.1 DUF72 domain-containing protein [Pseudomonadota bacterium]